MTVSEAFNRYIFDEIHLRGGADKTARNYVSVLNSLLKACGDIPVQLITYDVVIRWKMYMHSNGNQLSTIASNLSRFREVLKYLKRHEVAVLDPSAVESPRVPKKEAVWLVPEEIKRIMDCCTNSRDKAIVASLFSSGGRISEVLSLNRDSIQDGKAQVVGKGSKLITLYFDTTALRLIDEYIKNRSDRVPALFISAQFSRISVSRVEQIIHRLAGEAGVEKNVTPHVFRHSFATDLLMNGSSLQDVQQQLNHSNITTTQIYTHFAKSYKDETYRRNHTVL